MKHIYIFSIFLFTSFFIGWGSFVSYAVSGNTLFRPMDLNILKTSIEIIQNTAFIPTFSTSSVSLPLQNSPSFFDSGNINIPESLHSVSLSVKDFILNPFSSVENLPLESPEGSLALVQDKGLFVKSSIAWVALHPVATIDEYIDNIGQEQGARVSSTTTDDFTPLLRGSLSSALFPGEFLQIFKGSTYLGNAVVNNTAWTFQLPYQSEGFHQYSIKIIRNNGNHKEYNNNFAVTIFAPSSNLTPGKMVSSSLVLHSSLSQIQASLQGISKIPNNFVPQYGVKSYKIEYYTTNQYGNTVLASGLVSIPQKSGNEVSPMMSFQHGTIFENAESPSNSAASYYGVLASLGYIVVAADYVGYGSSHGQSHPYLQYEPSANAVIDCLKASREFIMKNQFLTNEQLFLTGYSEGGYVTMAAHKKLESLQSKVFIPMYNISGAGPYNLSLTLDLLIDRLDLDSFTKYLLSSKTLTKMYAETLAETISDELNGNGDVIFDDQFLVDYFQDNQSAIVANNVNKWHSLIPILLTHGRNDETVPFENTPDAITQMQSMGTQSINFSECFEVPSEHVNCVKPYLQSVVDIFGALAKDL